MMITAREMMIEGMKKLAESGVEEAYIDSRLLYCFVMKADHHNIFREYDRYISDADQSAYKHIIAKRAAGEPLQYIVGSQEFMGLTFFVAPGVLIPRQETEILVEKAIDIIKNKIKGCYTDPDISFGYSNEKTKSDYVYGGYIKGNRYSKGIYQQRLRVLDLCCGSGAIGLSVKKFCPYANVTLIDISDEAISISKKNASHIGIIESDNDSGTYLSGYDQCDKLRFIQGDLFEPLDEERFNLILSNPPYIPTDEIAKLQKEISCHEPKIALDGGTDGLNVYRRIAAEAADYMCYDGSIVLEIGADQGKKVSELFLNDDRYFNVGCLKDLAGRDRVVIAHKSILE